jgi:hypothetical protein
MLAITAWSASPASAQQPVLPKPGEGFEVWCKRLQDADPFVPFQCAVEDDWTDPGHPSRTQRVCWPGTDVGRSFELALALFKVPASVVPPPAGPPEQTIDDPHKPAAVWESTLTVRRAADGSLQELSWYERRGRRMGPDGPSAACRRPFRRDLRGAVRRLIRCRAWLTTLGR